jgi:hypothetical protein
VIDYALIILGRPGSGKTYAAKNLIKPWAETLPVVVHDPAWQFKGKPWRGNWGTAPAGLYVTRSIDADELVDSRISFCESQPDPRSGMLVIDEASAWLGERRSNPPPPVKKLLMQRRHWNTPILALAQHATLLPLALWDTATAVMVFNCAARDVSLLAARGVPESDCAKAPKLKRGQHVYHSFAM